MKILTKLFLATGLLLGGIPAHAAADTTANIQQGKYLFDIAGCANCHASPDPAIEGPVGGKPIETRFGTFFPPNITPDTETGIGSWKDADFLRAMREGRDPQGCHYYPAFPYTSYSHMTDTDILAIKAYLMSLPPVKQQSKEHEITWFLKARSFLGLWKSMHFNPGERKTDPEQPETWNRGAYLVDAVSHCGECHTPRSWCGGPLYDRFLAGTLSGPEGTEVPNITSHKTDGIGNWSKEQIEEFLLTGKTAHGYRTGGSMVQVIEKITSQLSKSDRAAMAEYLLTTPPLPWIDDTVPPRVTTQYGPVIFRE